MRVAIIVGTRPEIIKLAPVIKRCKERGLYFVLIHSNQHYSRDMDAIFFENLEIPTPKYNLKAGGGTHIQQISTIMSSLETILVDEKIEVSIVQGDTNTVLAGGLASNKLGIKVAHVEAGLRSYDNSMPEEINRIIVDNFSDYLFAVTETQEKILLSEGINKNRIFTVGNTIVDSLLDVKKRALELDISEVVLGIKAGDYFLLTAHRPSNVDTKEGLKEIISMMSYLSDKFEKKVICPIHPRTEKMIKEFEISIPESFIILGPKDYVTFVALIVNASAVMTDSGGIQEECCILGVPCITLRENTERPETVEVKSNFVVGRNPQKAEDALDYFIGNKRVWTSPFGDGNSANRILDILNKDFV